MNDLFLVVFLPIVVVLLGAIYMAIDSYLTECRHDCRHEWGTWEREKDTEYAVVQSRVCKKCFMHQVHQVRKMGDRV
jgi:hypothetical protein